jgi:SNF2 family DNA or RNA helicase
VLVFSQFVKQLRNIAGKLMEMHHDFCYIDGSTSPSDRSMEVERFQEDEWVRIFLISLKAGGTGLNLTEADYVFLADPWWNPAVEQQAIDRSHRIGQTKTVFSYKFITRNSIEEKIHMLQQKKKFWSDSIITTEEGFIKHLDENDIEQLLI